MKLQIALDLDSADKAVAMAAQVYGLVDIIELGTPLMLKEGVGVVGLMKRRFPDALILADMKIADGGYMEARFAAMKRPVLQGKMGEPDSNMDWKEIKKALDEQSFEAFWIVEREDFYGDNHDQCLADDSAWLHANIQ